MNVLLVLLLPAVAAQECFSGGAVSGGVIGGFLAGALAVVVGWYLWKLYLRRKHGKHLVLSTDPENAKGEFAFDNAAYQDEMQAKTSWQHEAPTLPLAGKNKPLQPEFTRATLTSSKDDLYNEKQQPARKVQLWAKDFAGLGFTVEGGARDGVRVHSVLRNGPASAAGIQPGEKINSIKINLVGCVLEDAVQVLALVSPYPVELEVSPGGSWKRSAHGSAARHPLLRSGSCGDVTQLEREGRHLQPPRSPNTSHSNNSTLETKARGIKKIITEKIITTTTLERAKKDKAATLERENEKNAKIAKNRLSEPVHPKQDQAKTRNSTGTEIHHENGAVTVERVELQKRENEPKRGMKFGIRVLPPNVPDDGVIKKSLENGDVQTKSIDEPDKARVEIRNEIRNESEDKNVEKPVVAKRRDKTAPPVPNARHIRPVDTDSDNSANNSRLSEQSTVSTFLRDDLNSSGIKRDENGIPQELPQHMLEAAMFARSNRKSVPDFDEKDKNIIESAKPKKIKGKAPMPPEERYKTEDSIAEQLKEVDIFLNTEKLHSSMLHDSIDFSYSTPKISKTKSVTDSMNFSQDDIDEIISKPFKRESDSLNNFYEDSKSNLSSNQDVHSVVSLNNSDKVSTTIELNNSDITIHSSPNNETIQSISDEASILDEHERKATSLGDLSRFENRGMRNPSQGTLERAQSLDISADDEGEIIKSPKRKALSVVESNFLDSSNVENLPQTIESETIVIKSKEPRLSLNFSKSPAMEGLSTFQRNRLKKGSEFGNLEDAIVKGSNSSIESEKEDIGLQAHKDFGIPEFDLSRIGQDEHETSDEMARKIIDENMKVHLKLVSQFAKSTSDGSSFSSLDHEPKSDILYSAHPVSTDFPNSLNLTYDTNIPDDMKMSRHSFGNSLERPKSDMMKKLLAKNPTLNVHADQIRDEQKTTHTNKPDVVNFNLKRKEDTDDFVSNIRIGSNNNSLTYNKGDLESSMWDQRQNRDKQNNIITITSERSGTPTNTEEVHTKSIEIGERTSIPDVIEDVTKMKHEEQKVSSRTYFTEDTTAVIDSKEPIQKKVTVNVTEDGLGNKVITQNVEQISTKYIVEKTKEAPLQIEQVTFGIVKNPKDIETLALEEAENIKNIDKKILEEIKKQNPGMHFTSDEPAYSKTETIILNTNLNEPDALVLIDKLKDDPTFISQKSPYELSRMGVRIIHDLEDQKEEDDRHVEVTKTRYSINPNKIAADDCEDNKESNEHHITEIQVVTPHTEKLKRKEVSNSGNPSFEPVLSHEVDKSLLLDFISNERRQSALEAAKRPAQSKPKTKERHSDFDLPRNTQIKFKTSTYESPKCTIVTSTDIEHKRLSEMDKECRTKPAVLAKPSNIPVKTPEKVHKTTTSPSKIPVFMSQKSQSQENLSDKGLSLPRSPIQSSSSSGNISITSIKSSSRNPSGK